MPPVIGVDGNSNTSHQRGAGPGASPRPHGVPPALRRGGAWPPARTGGESGRLSQEKHCSISAMLRKAAPITYRVVVAETSVEPVAALRVNRVG